MIIIIISILLPRMLFGYYLRKVNEVNGEDNAFLCLCVRSRPVNQASLTRLKLRTSNLTCMFPGKVQS